MQSTLVVAGANAPDQPGVPASGAGELDFSDVHALCPDPPADLALLVEGSRSAGPEPFQMKGDPYAEMDDVVRGCVLPSGLGALPGDWACGALADGDWYHGLEQGPISPDFCQSHGACDMPFWEDGPLRDIKPQARDVVFSDAVEPRELPFGQHEVTSVFLEGASPAQAATCVHTFLVQEVKSSMQEVKPEKFVIKADVFDEEGGCLAHCALKARVVRVPRSPDGGHRLLVEFRRRRGDPLVFSRLFGRASQYILGRLSPTDLPEEVAADLQAPCAPLCTPAAELELQPLVDMLTDSSLPEAQAEAVSALVAVGTASAAGAIAVCAAVSHVQHVLAALVASTCLDVAYPAARLAAMLASRGADELSGPLLLAARDGARFAGTDSLVRSELVEACGASAM